MNINIIKIICKNYNNKYNIINNNLDNQNNNLYNQQ